MVCQVCKNDDLFKDLPKGVGQEAMDLEKLGEEVAIAVSYAGPGIVNPYGIMLGDEDYVGETEMKCRAKREKDREARKMNWGKMKYCGYAESRPYALVEAYANEGRRLAQDEE